MLPFLDMDLPASVFCPLQGGELGLPHDLDLYLELVDGRYQVSKLTVSGGPVTSDSLRALPIDRLIERAVAVTLPMPELRIPGPWPPLEAVAEAYRLGYAIHLNPVQTVMKLFNKPRGTATRWVSLARKQGFLGPARAERIPGEA